MEAIQKQYNDYKEKVIHNYEYWFMSFILEDISEAGGFETLLDDYDELLFNITLTRELQNIIENILHKNGYREILIDFLKLKKITDKRILENKFYDIDLVKEHVFDIKNTSQNFNKNNAIEINPNLENQLSIQGEIFNFAVKEGYIKCDKESFIRHFESKNYEKLVWYGKLNELATFIQMFYDYDIISMHRERGKKIQLALDHFSTQQSEIINKKTMSKEFSFAKNGDDCAAIRVFFGKIKCNFK